MPAGTVPMNWREAVVSGLIVVLGVVVAHYLEQRAARMRDIRRDALEFGHVLSRIVGGYADSQADTSEGSDWWEHRQRAFELSGRLRVAIRSTPMRRGREVRRAYDRIAATLSAADSRRISGGGTIPRMAIFDLTTTDLEQALFPRSSRSLYAEFLRVEAFWKRDLPSFLPPDPPPAPPPLRERLVRWLRHRKKGASEAHTEGTGPRGTDA
jgi:hypothetical protein